jgi:aspartate carbamoyltransferase catalytic subunit
MATNPEWLYENKGTAEWLEHNADGMVDLEDAMEPIDGQPKGKHFLSVKQLSADDIRNYISESHAAKEIILRDPPDDHIGMLPGVRLLALMRQESTRTGGSNTFGIEKLGGYGELISGMIASSEAKGEILPESWVAIAAQTNILATRTKEQYGPAFAAWVIDKTVAQGRLPRRIPTVNAGDGENEHPTQFIGDIFTLDEVWEGEFEGRVGLVAGAHDRYRAFHSFMLGGAKLGMKFIAIETPAATIPEDMVEELGDSLLLRTEDMDEVIGYADAIYMGRKPDEYNGDKPEEILRSRELDNFYTKIALTYERLKRKKTGAVAMHPRPRGSEVHTSVDRDASMIDVQQMYNLTPARMAVIAGTMGKSIVEHIRHEQEQGTILHLNGHSNGRNGSNGSGLVEVLS